MKKQKNTALLYFSHGKHTVLATMRELYFTTERGMRMSFKKAVKGNRSNCERFYGKNAHCTARLLYNGELVLSEEFTT